eukprot:m.5563 g.5563  ORF g.5563 m.5563 type:complete len:623 (-) comp2015_c0_seq1:174-2042(-)
MDAALVCGVGPCTHALRYCRREWAGTTPKACAVRAGYELLAERHTSAGIRVVRGDNFCALRAVLFQLLLLGGRDAIIDILQDTDICLQQTPQLASLAGLLPLRCKADASSVCTLACHVLHSESVAAENDILVLEAIKLAMLCHAVHEYNELQSGLAPEWVMLFYARADSEDPPSFARQRLSHVGHGAGLDMLDMCLLAATLKTTIVNYRLSSVHDDFVVRFPMGTPASSGAVEIAVVSEDDRHYNVLCTSHDHAYIDADDVIDALTCLPGQPLTCVPIPRHAHLDPAYTCMRPVRAGGAMDVMLLLLGAPEAVAVLQTRTDALLARLGLPWTAHLISVFNRTARAGNATLPPAAQCGETLRAYLCALQHAPQLPWPRLLESIETPLASVLAHAVALVAADGLLPGTDESLTGPVEEAAVEIAVQGLHTLCHPRAHLIEYLRVLSNGLQLSIAVQDATSGKVIVPPAPPAHPRIQLVLRPGKSSQPELLCAMSACPLGRHRAGAVPTAMPARASGHAGAVRGARPPVAGGVAWEIPADSSHADRSSSHAARPSLTSRPPDAPGAGAAAADKRTRVPQYTAPDGAVGTGKKATTGGPASSGAKKAGSAPPARAGQGSGRAGKRK